MTQGSTLDRFKSVAENITTRDITTVDTIEREVGPVTGYSLNVIMGFLHCVAEKTVGSEGYPHVGLKVHVNLDPNRADYAQKLAEISNLCIQPDSEGKSTTFKIRLPSVIEGIAEEYPDESKKVITIYPNYIHSHNANVEETIRLVKGLREIFSEDEESQSETINREHKAGNHIFVRLAALDEVGSRLEANPETSDLATSIDRVAGLENGSKLVFKYEVSRAIKVGNL